MILVRDRKLDSKKVTSEKIEVKILGKDMEKTIMQFTSICFSLVNPHITGWERVKCSYP